MALHMYHNIVNMHVFVTRTCLT